MKHFTNHLIKTALSLVCVLTITLGNAFATASTSYLEQTSISISKSKVPLKVIFEEIEKQTNLVFVYDNATVDNSKITSISVTNKPIREILDMVLSGTNLTYSVSDKYVTIKKNDQSSTTLQQGNAIKGTVKDSNGEPIIGGTVRVKGTSTAATTDINGNYKIEAPEGSIIEFLYLGMKKSEVKVAKQTTVDVTMQQDDLSLNEVIVVGYGTQKKVNVIGSISSVSSSQLQDRPTSTVTQALTGQMPGVTITQPGGSPGVNTGTIRVRGVGSFGSSPDALVLVDGILGRLDNLNPDDITSISVLKDAASAAIYGARAANGVILVTTKSGQSGKIAVSYNGYFGVNKATALPEFVNTWEYAELKNKASNSVLFKPEEIQAMKDGSQRDVWANEKFVDQVFAGDGIVTSHEASLNGGSDRSQYFVSFGYMSQNGIVELNNYTRYNARVNLTSNITEKLKMTIRTQATSSNVKQPNIAGSMDGSGLNVLIQQGLRYPGIYPSVLSDGTWGPGYNNYGSPTSWIHAGGFIHNPSMFLNGNLKFDYNPIKELTISAMGGYTFTSNESKTYRATLPVTMDGRTVVLGTSSLTDAMSRSQYKTFQATADYQKSFGKNNIIALLGYSWEDYGTRNISASRDKYPGNDLPFLDSGSPENQQNSGGGNDWAIQSFFGRVQYNFNERYLAEATARYDGSSRFPNSSKYGFFPGAAIGWRLSEESFIKDNIKWIDNLKLKASTGVLGNDNIGNYPYQSVYALGRNYPFGQTISQGAAMMKYVDPNLKWETTRTTDVGLEFILSRGLLSGSVTYFDRYTYDILSVPSASVSNIFGLNLSEINTGELKNTGWEFELGHRNQVGDFSYNINANLSIIKNEIISLGQGNVNQPNGLVGNGSSLFLGYPMQIYYGYVTDGVFLNQADIDEYYKTTNQSSMGASQANTKPGDIRYKDISGPDGVADGVVNATYDRVYLGSSIPKYTFGVSLGAAYKGFDFSALIQGVAGVKGMLNNYAGWGFYSNDGNVQRWMADGAFKEDNPERYPVYPRLSILGNSDGINNRTSDWWVRDASYVRLKNLTLGYSLPVQVISKIGMSRLRFYVSLENAYTWNMYPQGWDPEISSGGQYYPVLGTYTFGLNLKF